uniref:Uncharacterized protein n=1 Tax=Arundo donax TaxID=35708 RepID=A0A0A9EEU8_ARUDO
MSWISPSICSSSGLMGRSLAMAPARPPLLASPPGPNPSPPGSSRRHSRRGQARVRDRSR